MTIKWLNYHSFLFFHNSIKTHAFANALRYIECDKIDLRIIIKTLFNFYLINDLFNAEQQSLHIWAIYDKYWQFKDSVMSLLLLYFTLLTNQFLIRLLLNSRICFINNYRSFNQTCDNIETNFYLFCEQKSCKLDCCNRNLLIFAWKLIFIEYFSIWYIKYILISSSNVYWKKLETTFSSIHCLTCFSNCSEFWRKSLKQLKDSNETHQKQMHCFEMLSNWSNIILWAELSMNLIVNFWAM